MDYNGGYVPLDETKAVVCSMVAGLEKVSSWDEFVVENEGKKCGLSYVVVSDVSDWEW